MIVKVFENEEFAGRAAADAIIAQISAKPNSVLGLPTGSTPVPTYRALSAACAEGRVSFKDVKTFNLDEYVGLNPAHEQSYRYFMDKHLFDDINIDKARTHVLFGQAPDWKVECAEYDAAIEAAGATPDMNVSDLCDAMKEAMTSVSYSGITGKDITWGEDGEPNKAPLVVKVVDGEYTEL